jgi:hypothetical protein
MKRMLILRFPNCWDKNDGLVDVLRVIQQGVSSIAVSEDSVAIIYI